MHPKRPLRYTLIAFVILSAVVGGIMPFDDRLRLVWPFAFGYCAFLPFAAVGLARLGSHGLLLLGIPAAVAFVPGVVGFALILHSNMSGGVWLRVSLYLFYTLAAWGLYLVVKGWRLYFTEPNETT